MYKVFSMDILGNGGGGFNSLLGRIGSSVSNSGNSGVNNETIQLLNTVFTFNETDTEVKKNLNLVDGELLVNVPDSRIKEYTINDYMRLLFEQPPAFETVSIQPRQTKLDLSWNKGGLYDQPRYISFLDKDLPDVQDIVVKITDTSTSQFIYRTYPKSTTSVDFAIDTLYPTQIQGGSASLTFVTDISYEFEVYARNSNTTDTHYYVQTVGPVQFEATGTPGQPRNVSFASITANTITLTLTRPEFSDSIAQSNEATIEGYRVVYEPLVDEQTSQRLTYTDVNTSAVTYDIASGNGENITIQITDNHDQDTGDGRYILPLTVYQINSVSAKNTVNSAYGTEVIDITQTRKSGFTYSKFQSVNPLANGFSSATKNVYNPDTDSSSNINYFTYGSGSTQLQHDISASSLYVNRTDDFSLLGKESKGLTDMVHVSVQWRKGTSAYVQDCFVSFNGYTTGGTGIEPATTTNDTGNYFKIMNVSVADAVSTDTKFANFGILGRFKVAMRAGKLSATDLSASQTPYQVNYIVDGTANTPAIEVNGTTTKVNKTYTFYVDDLVGLPSIDNVTASISQVQSVQWNHGIPSIDLFNVTTTFDLTNIGSQFLPSNRIVGQLRSNSASQIRDLSGTNVTTNTTNDMIEVARSLTSLYFTNSIGTSTPVTEIANGIQITAINLNGQTGYTNYTISTLGKKLHCDYDSFTKSGGSIHTPNHGLSLCTWDGTQTTVPTTYDNTTAVADNQLVYYNGVFHANGDAYKDWTSSTGNYLWSSGVTGFDYSGKTTIPQEGKWVVAKFTVNIASDADRYQITYSGTQVQKIYTKQIMTGINTPWMDTVVDIDESNYPFTDENRDNPNLGNKTSTGLQYYPGVSTIYVRIMSKNTVNHAISIIKIN